MINEIECRNVHTDVFFRKQKLDTDSTQLSTTNIQQCLDESTLILNRIWTNRTWNDEWNYFKWQYGFQNGNIKSSRLFMVIVGKMSACDVKISKSVTKTVNWNN